VGDLKGSMEEIRKSVHTMIEAEKPQKSTIELKLEVPTDRGIGPRYILYVYKCLYA
jgi:hypothetical protein